MKPVLQRLGFEEALPLLVSLNHQGRLVPFIGAGMSTPLLNLWEPFVDRLERAAGIVPDVHATPEMRAQRASTKIRNNCGTQHLNETLRMALEAPGTDSPVPRQTVALAAIRWPLVISTNYDDLFYGACRCRRSACELASELVGRSSVDCKRVVSALSGPFDREYIWHIQGFLGGQYPDSRVQADFSKPRLDALRKELVIGHTEYRLVTNTAVHFRRCFGAVFQSRSLLFLGSNLTEPYFMNLFGEVLDLCGPSSVPHFAFAKKGALDCHFLAEQMNITVCEFDEEKGWDQLPEWLGQLKCAIERPNARTSRYSFGIGTGADLEIVPGRAPDAATQAREAIALVAREDAEQRLGGRFPDVRFPDSGEAHVVRYGESEFYAVTAHGAQEKTAGDGSDVYTAGQELFDRVAADGFEILHVELPAVGGTVPPVYAFIESVRSYGLWKKQHKQRAFELILHVGGDVMLNLTSNRIDIRELLTSNLTRFWAVVSTDSGREPVRRALYYAPETRLEDVLDDLAVPRSSDWFVSVSPSPHRDGQVPSGQRTTIQLSDRTLVDIGVAFGSILTVNRPEKASCAAVA
jgi:hypothetical protein